MVGKWELQVGLKQINALSGAMPVSGDVLLYEAGGASWGGGATAPYLPRNEWLQNGFVSRADNTISFVNGTLRFTVAPTGASFDYYYLGALATTVGDFHDITNVDGQHWLYYDNAVGTIRETVNPSHAEVEVMIEDGCLIAMVYWNTNTAEGYLFDERHGYWMSPATHRWIHESIGMTWGDGLGVVDILTDQTGALDTHAQFGNTAGEVYDEDVGHDINAFAGGDTYECWWWDGTRWQWDVNAGFPFLVGGTPQPQYNNFGAGTLVEGGNNNFVLTHLFATSAEDGDPIIIVGQAVYGNVNAARDGAADEISTLLLGNLPSPELKPIATVIFQIANAYANTNNCRTRTAHGGHDWVDWRSTPISPGGGVATDHGSLGGLADDDHAWALNINGRAGGQVVYGGTAAAENLTLHGTSHATLGGIGIGAAPASASELLALTSITAALVLPRMTTVQVNAIVAPVDGMVVYDTTVGAVFAREGGAWVNI